MCNGIRSLNGPPNALARDYRQGISAAREVFIIPRLSTFADSMESIFPRYGEISLINPPYEGVCMESFARQWNLENPPIPAGKYSIADYFLSFIYIQGVFLYETASPHPIICL
jgi:hypothetical protein